MALRELKKPVTQTVQNYKDNDKKAAQFIANAGALATDKSMLTDDHRLTLRIPQWLMAKVDEKRRERIGTISRNLWILELIEKACKK